MTSLTRGPLPARVYWRRRLLLLGVALALVVGIARLLGAGSDASSGASSAAPAAASAAPSTAAEPTAAEPTSAATTGAPTEAPTSAPTGTATGPETGPAFGTATGPATRSAEPVLAVPEGPCADGDVAVTPEVRRAVAGREVRVALRLRTLLTPACTWRVSAGTLTLKVTSGDDDIWSTRECPKAVPVRDVVLRQAVTTTVGVRWSSRRSDETCSRLTEWALPGYYHVAAAALAGEPSDAQFELVKPAAPRVTVTPRPTQRPETRGRNGGRGPAASPSEAVASR